MSHSSRRNFIKKNISRSLLLFLGAPLSGFAADDQLMRSPLSRALKDKDEIDWGEIRKQFLLSENMHYFNTGSLGPSPHAVVDKVCDMMKILEQRAYDGHTFTPAAHDKIGAFLNTTSEEIAVTRNATEGMNIVARSLPLEAGDEILLTNQEHIGGAAPWLALQKDKGVVVKLIKLDPTGENNLQIIKESITDKTKVVSFSHVTFTTGIRLPAKEIADVCREKGIYSCIDGAQAIGMIPIDLTEINPDFYIGSGHKWLFGPKGTGILFMNKSAIKACSPVFVGAYTDKKFDLNTLAMEYRTCAHREEYGTRNTPIIVGLGSAIDFISTIGIENIEERGRALANYFRAGIDQIPEITILTPADPQYASSIVTISINNIDHAKVSKSFSDTKQLKVRVIFENGISGLRLSFSIFNSKEEIDFLLAALQEVVAG
ncbi:MAG: aminotransferase class V-fold PLP-dependent enzyme [Bacteroidia bacterium]